MARILCISRSIAAETPRTPMVELSHLLLFDSDPSGLDTLTYGFEKDGHSTTGTTDAAKARELILSGKPSLFLVRIRPPEAPGLDLIRTAGAAGPARHVPCVGMGPAETRDKALAAGAVAFLSAPLFVRDAINACRLVAAGHTSGNAPSADGEIATHLASFHGLYYLIRALAVMGRSAALDLRTARQRGDARFVDGALASAELASLQGFPALHQLLLWQDADLKLRFGNVVQRGRQFSLPATELVDECERFLRDFVHEIRDLGSAHTIYAAPPAAKTAAGAPVADVTPVFRLCDGQRSLATVLEESPFRIFDTLKILKRLRDVGAIEARPDTLPASPSAGDRDALGLGAAWLQRPAPSLGAELDPDRTPPPSLKRLTPSRMSGAAAPVRSSDLPGTPTPEPAVVAGPAKATPMVARGEIVVQQSRPRVLNTVAGKSHEPSVLVEDMTGPVSPQAPASAPTGSSTPSSAAPASAAAPALPRAWPPASVAQPVPGDPPAPVGPPAPAAVAAAVGSANPAAKSEGAPEARSEPPAAQPPGDSVNGVGQPRPRGSASGNFDALETDFFAREADLYRREAVETFDDLDHPRGNGGGAGNPKKR